MASLKVPFNTIPLYQAVPLPIALNARPVTSVEQMYPAIEANFINFQAIKAHIRSDIPEEFNYYFVKKAVIIGGFVGDGLLRQKTIWTFLAFFKHSAPIDKLVTCLEIFFGRVTMKDLHLLIENIFSIRESITRDNYKSFLDDYGLEDVYIDGSFSLYQLMRLTLHYIPARRLELPQMLFRLVASFAHCPGFSKLVEPFYQVALAHLERIVAQALRKKMELTVAATQLEQMCERLQVRLSPAIADCWYALWRHTIYLLWNKYQLTFCATTTPGAINTYFDIQDLEKLKENKA